MTGRVIWAVSSGSYSDYSVHAIFERREDAEAAIAAGYLGHSYDKPEIEELAFYAPGELPVKDPLITYFGWVNIADGEVTRTNAIQSDNWVHPGEKRQRVEVTTNIRPYPFHGPSRMELTVSGRATPRTHKVFTDALAKLRAECIEGMHGGAS